MTFRTLLASGLLALSTSLTGCAAAGVAEPTTIAQAESFGQHVDAATFRAVDNAVIIDVRTPEEYAQGHLPGAINLDVNAPDFGQQIAALDPESTYAVYCRSANRSRTALEMMQAAGLTRVVGLEGGIGALEPAELVTE